MPTGRTDGGWKSAGRNIHCSFCTQTALGECLLLKDNPLRRGLTLLEVLIALAIFLVSMTAISQLVRTGSRAAVEAQLEADAALRAETVLHEVLAGVHVMQNSQKTPFDDDPEWQWSLTIGDGPHIDLLKLDVTVERTNADGKAVSSLTLSRLVRNPELFATASSSGGL